MRSVLRLGAASLLVGVRIAVATPSFPHDPGLQAVPYFSGASFPTACVFLPTPPATPLQIFVCEKATGRVLWVRGGALQGVALDLAVNSFGERGLLGIALHPQFALNGFVFLYYTTSSTANDETASTAVGENRVVRFTWNGTTLGSPAIVLQLPADPSIAFHQGGTILFGPDGMLYGVIGDVGRFGKLQNVPDGPDPDDTSIVFRIRDDGSAPPDNPFFALGGAMQKVFAFGIRNSFGLDFDPATHVLWDTENGPAHYDEVNRIAPGFNSGWTAIMGPDERDPQGIADLWAPPGATYSDPEFSWLTPVAATAIHFVRSRTLGATLPGDCLVGAYVTRNIYRFQLDANRETFVLSDPLVADRVADTSAESDEFLWATGFDGGIVDLDTGPDGALYVLAFESGTIYRIVGPTSGAGLDNSPPGRLVAHPNPFSDTVRMRWEGTGARPWAPVTIYSADGRLVRRLAPGAGEMSWDGRDALGALVGAGAYFARSPGMTPLALRRVPRR